MRVCTSRTSENPQKGNHDDPAGGENLSALDLLATCNLVNYFGKHTLSGGGAGKIKLKPVLMQKGNTRVALYGLGYIRDARLHQMFSVKGNVEWARPENTEATPLTSWFNMMLIHQNRVSHTPKNAISERYLPSWLDLVVWGHEHECLVEPTDFGDFHVSQPGSSVATSLIEGEAKQKKIMLLEVRSDPEAPNEAPFWRATPINLETPRPFKYRHVSLMELARLPVDEGGLGQNWAPPDAAADLNGAAERRAGRRPPAAAHEAWTRDVLERNVREMIDDALAPFRAASRGGSSGDDDAPLPLIRLRVDYTGGFGTINAQRFGQKFVGKVANPNDVVQFHKSAARRRKEEGAAADAERARAAAEEETVGNTLMADQRRIENLVSANLAKGLQLLSESDLSNALDDFVNRDPSAISKLVERRMKETQALVDQEAAADVESDDEMTEHIRKAVTESAARAAPTERAAAAAAAAAEANAPDAADAERERERVSRAMAAGAAADAAASADATTATRGPRNAFEALGAGAQRAGGASVVSGARGRRGADPAPSATVPATAPPAPSQTTAKSVAPRARRSTAATRPPRGARSRAAAEEDSGDDVVSLDDSGDDSGDDDDVIPMSAPASRGRGRARVRPTRAAAAAKAAAATRGGGGRRAAPETEDAYEFDDSSDDEDEDAVSDSGDDVQEIRTAGSRGAKRKATAATAAAAKSKRAKTTPARKSPAKKPPPGRARRARAVEIDDSGDDDDEIPASVPASRSRRSTRAR